MVCSGAMAVLYHEPPSSSRLGCRSRSICRKSSPLLCKLLRTQSPQRRKHKQATRIWQEMGKMEVLCNIHLLRDTNTGRACTHLACSREVQPPPLSPSLPHRQTGRNDSRSIHGKIRRPTSLGTDWTGSSSYRVHNLHSDCHGDLDQGRPQEAMEEANSKKQNRREAHLEPHRWLGEPAPVLHGLLSKAHSFLTYLSNSQEVT